jgi:hypothetical protein
MEIQFNNDLSLIQNELNKKNYEQYYVVCEMQKKFDAYKSDFELRLVELNKS